MVDHAHQLKADERLTVIGHHHVQGQTLLNKNDQGLTMVNHGKQKFIRFDHGQPWLTMVNHFGNGQPWSGQ